MDPRASRRGPALLCRGWYTGACGDRDGTGWQIPCSYLVGVVVRGHAVIEMAPGWQIPCSLPGGRGGQGGKPQSTACMIPQSKGQAAYLQSASRLSSLLWANRRMLAHALICAAETLPTPGGSAHHGLLCRELIVERKKNEAPQVCWQAKQDISMLFSMNDSVPQQLTVTVDKSHLTILPWFLWAVTPGEGIRPNTAGIKTDRHEPPLLPRKPF